MNRLGFLTIVSTSLLLVACGDAFSPGSVSGTYQLVSVDGNPLPYLETFIVDELAAGMTINAASVTLNDDRTYSTSMRLDLMFGGVTESDTWTSSGTFTLEEPARIRFSDDIDDEQMSATLDGDRLTMIDEGASYVYER